MRFEQQVQYASATDIGLRRRNNEDACIARLCHDEEEFLRRGHLFIVADGMGGHAVGELASRLAVETVPHTFYKSKDGDARSALSAAVHAANEAINTRGSQNRDFQRMGTTCSSMALTPRGAVIAHVGDSRVYRLRRDRIDQLTFDHSLQWELRRHKKRLPDEFKMLDNRNIITRSLGPEPNVEVDIEGPHPVEPGDGYVICSDGLSSQVSDEEIGAIVRELSPTQACRLLVHLANLRGGADNCTAIVVRVGELPANAPSTPMPTPVDNSHGGFGWGWLAGFWIVSMAIVGGISLLLFGHLREGAFVASLGFVGLAVLGVAALRNRPTKSGANDPQTVLNRPHRTAVAMPNEKLVDVLSAVERDLRRAAHEEGWNVNWEAHQQAAESAVKSVHQGRFARGVRDFARAVDVLMTDLPKRRATVASALANAAGNAK